MNSYHETYSGCGYSIHAEIAAFKKICKNSMKKRKVLDLIAIRTTKQKIFRNSKPCSKCIKLLQYYCKINKIKIRNIFYSDEMGDIIKIKFSQLKSNHKTKSFKSI